MENLLICLKFIPVTVYALLVYLTLRHYFAFKKSIPIDTITINNFALLLLFSILTVPTVMKDELYRYIILLGLFIFYVGLHDYFNRVIVVEYIDKKDTLKRKSIYINVEGVVLFLLLNGIIIMFAK